jgi:hypothetical protein
MKFIIRLIIKDWTYIINLQNKIYCKLKKCSKIVGNSNQLLVKIMRINR